MNRAKRYCALLLAISAPAACNLPRERDWNIGTRCADGHCYQVVVKRKFRETSILEGEAGEKILGNKIIVTELDRASGKRREYPALVCHDVSCISHGVDLLICNGRVLPRGGRGDFSVGGESAANLRCDNPIAIGRFPVPLN
jgi:hypothetical protein